MRFEGGELRFSALSVADSWNAELKPTSETKAPVTHALLFKLVADVLCNLSTRCCLALCRVLPDKTF
jgi:hypothetical protein